MEKYLAKFSLEELWQLFPIELVDYKSEWAEQATEEIELLKGLLNDFSPIITHIGSTSIPGIQAKAIVDLIVELPENADYDAVRKRLESKGYICMSVTGERISFNKGYTPEGYAEKVFHIHVRRKGDNDEIRFRDYLRAHPEKAKEYERLKLSLLPKFRHDRDGYTAAKSDFVRRIMTMAKGDED